VEKENTVPGKEEERGSSGSVPVILVRGGEFRWGKAEEERLKKSRKDPIKKKFRQQGTLKKGGKLYRSGGNGKAVSEGYSKSEVEGRPDR